MQKIMEGGNTDTYKPLNHEDLFKAISELQGNKIVNPRTESNFYIGLDEQDYLDAVYRDDKERIQYHYDRIKAKYEKDMTDLLAKIGQEHFDIFKRVCAMFGYDKKLFVADSIMTDWFIYEDVAEEHEDHYYPQYVYIYYRDDKYSVYYTDGVSYSPYTYLHKEVEPEQIERIMEELKSKLEGKAIRL